MLGSEQRIIENYVLSGRARVVFWPVLDHGDSENATAAALCAGEQDPAAFWAYHDWLFEDQSQVFGADRDYYLDTAAALGLDGATFATCYDGDAARDLAQQLDDARRAANVFNRPTIDINGQRLIGAQPYETFAAAIDASTP